MQTTLSERIAIVTGGTAGLGLEIARTLAENGAFVVLFGRNAERGQAAVDQIGSERSQFMQVDVADFEAAGAAIQGVVKERGRVDILVNNAGITQDNLLLRMSEEQWDTVLNINLKSCFNTCKAVMRPMMKQRSGKIINITSVVGLMGNPGQTNYAASKAGMIGFSKSLAREMASRGITVNCVAPGYCETDMTDALGDEVKAKALEHIPLGRMGRPEDIAQAVLFLSSSGSDYITGQVLTVDGGFHM